jgi:hypothetical protein
MGKNTAEYMRDYRARKKAEGTAAERIAYLPADKPGTMDGMRVENLMRYVAELEAEVAHLKRELAKRGVLAVSAEGKVAVQPLPGYSTRPFTPVPKKGK